jgi:excisionase family DNA binding protein
MKDGKRSETDKEREPWLDSQQAAAYMGFRSMKAFSHAVWRHQIPAHRFGRRLRFRASELDAAIIDGPGDGAPGDSGEGR